jgi:hypothetical protein
MASLHFWRPSQDSYHVAMVEPPVSYLEPTLPAAACEIAVSIRTASCAGFACRALSLRPPSTSYTISARLPPLWQEKRLLQTSWMLALQRMATRGGRTGKKTVGETVISTGTDGLWQPSDYKLPRKHCCSSNFGAGPNLSSTHSATHLRPTPTCH